MTTYFSEFESPLGRIYLQGDGHALSGLYFPKHKHWAGPDAAAVRNDDALAEVRTQLAEYFAGTRREFELPIRTTFGTTFQRRVWDELTRIPFGATISYAELAERVGSANGFRAVGAANGRNPISIIVPCHRVIASDGKLTGYGGGLDRKLRMLDWERSVVAGRAAGDSLYDSHDQTCTIPAMSVAAK